MSVPFFRYDPYLQKFHRFRFAAVHLAMINACTGTHHLNIAYSNGTTVLLLSPCARRPFKRYGDDFHIFMGMGLKTFTRGYPVIVQYPQSTRNEPVRDCNIRQS